MPRKPVIGVMGGATADPRVLEEAERLGALIADRGWVLLTGGRAVGVMEAASRGARAHGGLVLGVLPFRSPEDGAVSEHVDVAVFTGMGDARNAVNVLTSDVVVALPGGAGTLSEVALAMKSGKPVLLLGFDPAGLPEARVRRAATPDEAVHAIADALGERA